MNIIFRFSKESKKKEIEKEEVDLYLFLCYGCEDETEAFNKGEYF